MSQRNGISILVFLIMQPRFFKKHLHWDFLDFSSGSFDCKIMHLHTLICDINYEYVKDMMNMKSRFFFLCIVEPSIVFVCKVLLL